METFTPTLLVVFRETLEAGLMVGIVLTVLARLEALRYRSHVLLSTLAAVLLSFALAFVLQYTTKDLKGILEKCLEGGISILACWVLTHMIFWMDRQAQRIRPEIEDKVREAVVRQEYWAIISIPFLAVLREGAETVLFLQAVAIQHSRAVSWIGGTLGAAGALAVSWLIFIGGKKLPVRTFFRTTGIFLLLVAAGLLAYGIHEFQELGFLPFLEKTAWNTNPILNEKEGVGAFLKSLLGYNGNPSVLEVIVYSAYLLVVGFFLKSRPRETPVSR